MLNKIKNIFSNKRERELEQRLMQLEQRVTTLSHLIIALARIQLVGKKLLQEEVQNTKENERYASEIKLNGK